MASAGFTSSRERLVAPVLRLVNALRLLGSATRHDSVSCCRSRGCAARAETGGSSRSSCPQAGAGPSQTRQRLSNHVSDSGPALDFLSRLGGKPGPTQQQAKVGTLCGQKYRALASSCHGSWRSEEHTSELQSHHDLVCRLLL